MSLPGGTLNVEISFRRLLDRSLTLHFREFSTGPMSITRGVGEGREATRTSRIRTERACSCANTSDKRIETKKAREIPRDRRRDPSRGTFCQFRLSTRPPNGTEFLITVFRGRRSNEREV